MDAVLESVANSLYNGTLPKEWAKLAPDTRKNLAGWMEHFERRIAQYTSWVCILSHTYSSPFSSNSKLYQKLRFSPAVTNRSSSGYQGCTVPRHTWPRWCKWPVGRTTGRSTARSCTRQCRSTSEPTTLKNDPKR